MRAYGERPEWRPERPPLRPLRVLLSWAVSALGLLVAAVAVPGVEVSDYGWGLLAVALVAVLNAVLPPLLAALRLPLTLLAGFVLVAVADALMLLVASEALAGFDVGGFGRALLVSLLAAALTMALEIVVGINDDDRYTIQVTRRVARRQGPVERTDVPGILFLEIDGLALPVLVRAVRDGNAPTMARLLSEGGYELVEWETDLSSQTGASQAGILLGSNEDVPAFRWVEKERGRLISCSDPGDCAEIERRHATGRGLLRDGGASRGNLLSGEADAAILTVSRLSAERGPNPGYRSFLANGSNIARALVLFVWEVALELPAAARQRRRDVRPRGHRGGAYPLLRGGMCVLVRDLVVHATLSDMMAGRPAVYATFASYDEVAHHSGLERQDTLEALRKLDQQFGRIERARRYAPRPYEMVVLSDHGHTQGATFRQRNGYGLDDLVRGAIAAEVAPMEAGDENDALVGQALDEATGRDATRRGRGELGDQEVIVLASGNLGLVYLLEEPGRVTEERILERYPDLLPTLRAHPHVGFVMVRSEAHGPVVLGADGVRHLDGDRVEGTDPLAGFPPGAAAHLRRTDGFAHAPDVLVNSFFDPDLEEGCAFEELISFHGGLGGPQTRPFILYPATLPAPTAPIVGAAAVHDLLAGWRRVLQG